MRVKTKDEVILLTSEINAILGIDDIFKAPTRLMEILLDQREREKVFNQVLELSRKNSIGVDLDFWHTYFQDEVAERNKKKQDFTPMSVGNLVAKLVGGGTSYFEPAAGTGGMMIAHWHQNEAKNTLYYVEELSERTFPFLLFNMMIRGIEGVAVRCDSLTGEVHEAFRAEKQNRDCEFSGFEPKSDTQLKRYSDIVMMNPPFSANWSADSKFLSDPRFERFGKLAPKSKADFSFLLHGFYHLKDNGTMGIVLPHGVLFRGASEGVIRKTLLEMGAIYAVIGLPPNIFYGTSIPTVVLILKKNRTTRDVFFIDASKDFEKQKNQNSLRPSDIHKIVDAYKARENIEKYAHLASFDKIVSNDYNLNIPRYVDTFEEEEQIDIVALSCEITDLNLQIKQKETEFLGLLDELAVTDETKELITATKRIFYEG